jgi:phosphatidylglycerophosphate synthase
VTARRRRLTLAEVRATYSAERARDEWYGDWASALIYRPLSFLFTPVLALVGASPTVVSTAMLLLSLSLPLLAAGLDDGAAYVIAAVAFTCMVLDCADGNLARATNSASDRGAYVDFLADIVYRVCMYFAIGWLAAGGAAAPFTNGDALTAAVLAACVTLGARLCRFRQGRAVALTFYSATHAARTGALGVLERYAFPFVSGLDRLLPIFVVAAALSGGMGWLAAWLLLFAAVDFIYTQIVVIQRISERR